MDTFLPGGTPNSDMTILSVSLISMDRPEMPWMLRNEQINGSWALLSQIIIRMTKNMKEKYKETCDSHFFLRRPRDKFFSKAMSLIYLSLPSLPSCNPPPKQHEYS